MTIASEISRLQQAKSDIKTAIEGKGVEVGSEVKIDEMANCIENIPTGVSGVCGMVDLLIVGGGGCGGTGLAGGGGGGGGVIHREKYVLQCNTIAVTVGAQRNNSSFGSLIACRGGDGGANCVWYQAGRNGGSGGGSSGVFCPNRYETLGGNPIPLQGNSGGTSYTYCNRCYGGGGGGGAGGAGCPAVASTPANGGPGYTTDISGSSQTYAGGGGGSTYQNSSTSYPGCGGTGGGGNGNSNATYYGGGGGGCGGQGYQGIVILRYLTNGDCGIHSATGGCKYTCGDYTIHCFTSSDTFCIVC